MKVTDLRGTSASPSVPVLVDASGRRAKLLRRLGRFVAAVFVLWFVCLVLAGLGLFPASGVPFGSAVNPDDQAPGALSRVPSATPASRADLKPAVSVAASTHVTPGAGSATEGTTQAKHKRSPVSPGSSTTKTTPSTPPRPKATTPGNSGSAPGQTQTTPGNSGSAPGQTQTTPGKSGSAPGQTQTTQGNSDTAPGQTHTTTTGNSGSAPGHTQTTQGNSDTAPGQTHTTTTGHGPSG